VVGSSGELSVGVARFHIQQPQPHATTTTTTHTATHYNNNNTTHKSRHRFLNQPLTRLKSRTYALVTRRGGCLHMHLRRCTSTACSTAAKQHALTHTHTEHPPTSTAHTQGVCNDEKCCNTQTDIRTREDACNLRSKTR
jgi:hypothetical protein